MKPRIILDSKKFRLTLDRLCHQLIEAHQDFAQSALIGVQPRGAQLAIRLKDRLIEILGKEDILLGLLDTTFHRDDFRRTGKIIRPSETDLSFPIQGQKLILIDDVLFTGRTIRSAMDALVNYGRPKAVELLVLIDRRLQRHVPIEAKYVGKTVDSITSERVKVEWKGLDGADRVWIVPAKKGEG